MRPVGRGKGTWQPEGRGRPTRGGEMESSSGFEREIRRVAERGRAARERQYLKRRERAVWGARGRIRYVKFLFSYIPWIPTIFRWAFWACKSIMGYILRGNIPPSPCGSPAGGMSPPASHSPKCWALALTLRGAKMSLVPVLVGAGPCRGPGPIGEIAIPNLYCLLIII